MRVVGIRFENKFRRIGESCELSKHNEDRGDERDFPEYGTPEYEELPDLNGTSAYTMKQWEALNLVGLTTTNLSCEHIYLIGGDDYSNGPDDGEIVVCNAKVLAVIA